MKRTVKVIKEESIGSKQCYVVNVHGDIQYVLKHLSQIRARQLPETIEVEDFNDPTGNFLYRQTMQSLLNNCYEENCVYPFTIEGTGFDGEVKFYQLGDEYGFHHRLYENAIYLPLPSTEVGSQIECTVTSIKNTNIVLRFSFKSKAEALAQFEEGELYEFQVLAKIDDDGVGRPYLALKCPYGFSHRLYRCNPDNFNIGNKVKCIVKGINEEQGYLYLELPGRRYQDINSLISIEEVSNESYCPDLENHFKSLSENPDNLCTTLNTAIRRYENGNNLWILSYLTGVDKNLIPEWSKGKDYEKVFKYSLILDRLIQWMKGNRYMDALEKCNSKTESVLKKIDNIQSKNAARIEAARILCNNSQALFLDEVSNDVTQQYFYKKDEKLRTVCALASINERLFMDNFKSMLKILQYMEKEEGPQSELYRETVKSLLKERIEQIEVEKYPDVSEWSDYDVKRLDFELHLLLYSGLSNRSKETDTRTNISRSDFFRLLYRKSKSMKALYHSYFSLFYETFYDKYFTESFLLADLESLMSFDNIVYPTAEDIQSEYFITKRPSIIICKGITSICPFKSLSQYDLKQIKNHIQIPQTPFCIGNNGSSFTFGNINTISNFADSLTYFAETHTEINNETPQIGEELEVMVSRQDYAKYPFLTFVRILTPKYQGMTAVLNKSEITSLFVKSLDGVMKEGYIFEAKVSNVSFKDNKARVNISIKESVAPYEREKGSGEDALKRFLSDNLKNSSEMQELSKGTLEAMTNIAEIFLDKVTTPKDKLAMMIIVKSLHSQIFSKKSYHYSHLINLYLSCISLVDRKQYSLTLDTDVNLADSISPNRRVMVLRSILTDGSLSYASLGKLCDIDDPAFATAMRAILMLKCYSYEGKHYEGIADEAKNVILKYIDSILAADDFSDEVFSRIQEILPSLSSSSNIENILPPPAKEPEENVFDEPSSTPQSIESSIERVDNDIPKDGKSDTEISREKGISNEPQIFDIEEKLYINFLSNNTYVLSPEENVSMDGLVQRVTVPDNTDSSFLLQCYEGGYVNKFKLSTVVNRKIGTSYKNAFASDLTPVKFCAADDSMYLIAVSYIDGDIYIRRIPIADIPDKSTMYVKGSHIVSCDPDKMEYYLCHDVDDVLSEFEKDIVFSNGKQASKETLDIVINYIKEIG